MIQDADGTRAEQGATPRAEVDGGETGGSGNDSKATNRGLFYMFLPVLLLGASLTGGAIMMSIAMDDPGFAVERDYYKKASNYEEVIEQRRQNEGLGWQMAVQRFELAGTEAVLEVSLVDGAGMPVDVTQLTAIAFPVARAQTEQTVNFEPVGGGKYRARILAPRAGLWEVRVTALGPAGRFTAELRPELGQFLGKQRQYPGDRRQGSTTQRGTDT